MTGGGRHTLGGNVALVREVVILVDNVASIDIVGTLFARVFLQHHAVVIDCSR